MINKIVESLKNAKQTAIICHTSPDGDTLGAGLALYRFLLLKNKKAGVFCDGILPMNLSDLCGAEDLNKKENESFDVVVCVDTASFSRLGKFKTLLAQADTTIGIDHHYTNEKYCKMNLICSEKISCSEIMYDVLCCYDQSNIDQTIAELLLTGIVTDSGLFSFQAVTSQTHKTAAELLDLNADNYSVCYNRFKKTSRSAFDLSNRVLSKTKFYNQGQLAIVTIEQSDFSAVNANLTDTQGIINRVIDIDKVQIAVTLAEKEKNVFHISIRTKKLNASDMASVFGGGGHIHAAGLKINGLVEDVLDKMVSLCGRFLENERTD